MLTISGRTKNSLLLMYFSELTTATFSGVIVLPKCLIRSLGTAL